MMVNFNDYPQKLPSKQGGKTVKTARRMSFEIFANFWEHKQKCFLVKTAFFFLAVEYEFFEKNFLVVKKALFQEKPLSS